MGRSKSLLLAPIRFIGSILAFGVSFAGARLYNLEDYGNYQLTASSVAFFNVFSLLWAEYNNTKTGR